MQNHDGRPVQGFQDRGNVVTCTRPSQDSGLYILKSINSGFRYTSEQSRALQESSRENTNVWISFSATVFDSIGHSQAMLLKWKKYVLTTFCTCGSKVRLASNITPRFFNLDCSTSTEPSTDKLLGLALHYGWGLPISMTSVLSQFNLKKLWAIQVFILQIQLDRKKQPKYNPVQCGCISECHQHRSDN